MRSARAYSVRGWSCGDSMAPPTLTVTTCATGEAACGSALAHARHQALPQRLGMLGAAAVQQHGELLAAHARHQVQRPAYAGQHHLRHLLQHHVALLVAMAVVVALEIVHVHEQQCQRLALALRLGHELPDVVVEHAAVVEPRQRVAHGQPVRVAAV